MYRVDRALQFTSRTIGVISGRNLRIKSDLFRLILGSINGLTGQFTEPTCFYLTQTFLVNGFDLTANQEGLSVDHSFGCPFKLALPPQFSDLRFTALSAPFMFASRQMNQRCTRR